MDRRLGSRSRGLQGRSRARSVASTRQARRAAEAEATTHAGAMPDVDTRRARRRARAALTQAPGLGGRRNHGPSRPCLNPSGYPGGFAFWGAQCTHLTVCAVVFRVERPVAAELGRRFPVAGAGCVTKLSLPLGTVWPSRDPANRDLRSFTSTSLWGSMSWRHSPSGGAPLRFAGAGQARPSWPLKRRGPMRLRAKRALGRGFHCPDMLLSGQGARVAPLKQVQIDTDP